MPPSLDPQLVWGLASALLIGSLVGTERERSKALSGNVGIGGVRTFILFSLIGAVSAWLSQSLGKTSAGDRGMIIPALPRVPLALIFWRGDEDFPPEARIRFDSTISTYLSTEDVAVLSQQAVFGMIAVAKSTTEARRS